MEKVRLDPAGFFGKIPLEPHQLADEITRREHVIVLCHLGVPRIERDAWRLTIDGLVGRTLELNFDDLKRFPRHTITTIHQCAGSPLTPREPKRRIVNVRWSGARLADVLEQCGILRGATHVWSQGADYGEFGGVKVDRYQKDLPLSRLSSDVLIATELNGEPLPPENGYPARLVVPGFYGTNSVKWLNRITLADKRVDSPFTTRWYNDPVIDADGNDTGQTAPVWAIAPESVIVSPAPNAPLKAGKPTTIWGRAWSDRGIKSVTVSMDGGASWGEADLSVRTERAWQRFSLDWTPPAPGEYALSSNATDVSGARQPEQGARNALHHLKVTVTD